MHSIVQKTATYDVQIRNTNHKFTLKIESSKVEKQLLLKTPHPYYSEMQEKYMPLSDIILIDLDIIDIDIDLGRR